MKNQNINILEYVKLKTHCNNCQNCIHTQQVPMYKPKRTAAIT